MPTHSRTDITPKPAEFNAVPSERRVTILELLMAVLSMGALLLTVVAVDEPRTRMACVLLITGALSAFVALRMSAARRSTWSTWPTWSRLRID